MTPRLLTLPNLITIIRALLIPVIAYTLAQREFGIALLLFALCALGDLLDGFLARAAAVIARDVVIVFGAVAFHFLIHEYEMAPTRLSKLNTALEFGVLTGVLVDAAGIIEITAGLEPAYAALTCTIFASGLNYVWSWGRRAAKARSGDSEQIKR